MKYSFGVPVNNRCPFCNDHKCAPADCSSLCPCTGSNKEKTCKCPYKAKEDMPATAPEGGCCGGAGDKSEEVAS